MIFRITKKLLSFTLARTYLIAQFFTRIVLSTYALFHGQIEPLELLGILAMGLVNDFCSLVYVLPLALLTIAFMHKILASFPKLERILAHIALFIILSILIFNGISELMFWDEFGTKFNFIAVDYLIYTNEIIGTVKDTIHPVLAIIVVTLPAAIICYILRDYIDHQIKTIRITSHVINAVIFGVTSIFVFYLYSPKKINLSSNRYSSELAYNGPYEFFSAYNNNSLDYNQLYPKINKNRTIEILRRELTTENTHFLDDDTTIDRIIEPALAASTAKNYNVVIITVESLSAEFMGKFGNSDDITPNLDKLADESIFFTRLYATGTRTVRGLEAISLSVPPTPGSSIIRRPKNHNLFNIGSVFHKFNYDVNFVFGGYSYFDNLENYFSGNNFKITDRGSLKANEISFANIWGVADEDILLKSLEIGDANYAAGKSFFSLIMTTSNHRPYTFPDGKIDRPSGESRGAAVKYTDYAIGKFIEEAKKRPWFDNTIFVITADHCASSAGKTNLPIHRYHIPMLIYAPKILIPQKIENLASQIDIAPTIFGLLNFKYESKFFGSDIINYPAKRALISTYQLLGLLENEHLVVLSPNSQPQIYQINGEEKILLNSQSHLEQIEKAISYYQAAYDLYTQSKMQNFNSE